MFFSPVDGLSIFARLAVRQFRTPHAKSNKRLTNRGLCAIMAEERMPPMHGGTGIL